MLFYLFEDLFPGISAEKPNYHLYLAVQRAWLSSITHLHSNQGREKPSSKVFRGILQVTDEMRLEINAPENYAPRQSILMAQEILIGIDWAAIIRLFSPALWSDGLGSKSDN